MDGGGAGGGHNQTMPITVKSLTGETLHTNATTLCMLYFEVCQLLRCAPGLVRMIVNGRRLPQVEEIDKNRPLTEYGVVGGETVFVILRLGPPAIPLGPYKAAHWRSHPMMTRNCRCSD